MVDLPFLTSLAAAGALAMPGPAEAPQHQAPQHPIRLEVHETGGERVQLRVVGASPVAVAASYRLTVDAGSGNRSSQGGRVSIRPGQQLVMVDLMVTAGTPARWSAVLEVNPDNGNRYSERRGANE